MRDLMQIILLTAMCVFLFIILTIVGIRVKSESSNFVVYQISSTSKGEFIYNLKPLDGWGNIQILSEKRYNLGDTLNIRP